MFKTLLVPLDGSLRAEAALPMAGRIARQTGATLVLVRVVSFLSEYWPTMTSAQPSLAQAVVETDLASATEYLENVAASAELAGITVKTTAQFGPPAPTILAVATSYACDLIVLCSHGSAGMVHWMMGSVAEKISRHATVPVLVVRKEAAHLTGDPARIAQPLRMLIPLDGSDGAEAALEPGSELLLALAAPGQRVALHLARVAHEQARTRATAGNHSDEENGLIQARGYLLQAAQQISAGTLVPSIAQHQIPVTWSLLRDPDVACALLRVAEQGEDAEGAGAFGGCDLIAISTHGRSGFRRWMLGSIAERVLYATRRPILIVHPPAARVHQEINEQLSDRPFVHR